MQEDTFKPVLAERRMYATESQTTWLYKDERGPAVWSRLDDAYDSCEHSRMQSPIDIKAFRLAPTMASLPHLHYRTVRAAVRNTGNYLRVLFNQGSFVTWGEDRYELVYAQIHTPSEHRIRGVSFPAEVQYIHANQDGTARVAISVLYASGLDSPFLDRVLEAAPADKGVANIDSPINIIDAIPKDVTQHSDTYTGIPAAAGNPGGMTQPQLRLEVSRVFPGKFADAELKTMSMDELKQELKQADMGGVGGDRLARSMRVSYPHYSYDGSLTTPPCTDGVRWFVWAKPDEASAQQLESLRGLFKNANSRPTQIINNRIVELSTQF